MLIVVYLLFSIFFRGKALQVFVGGLRVAFCPLRRVDTSLPEAHGVQALQVQLLWPLFFPLGPLGAAHEATPVTTNTPSLVQRLLLSFYTDAFLYEHFLYGLFCAPWESAILPLFLFVCRTHCGKKTARCTDDWDDLYVVNRTFSEPVLVSFLGFAKFRFS